MSDCNHRELTKAVIKAQGYKVYDRLADMPMKERTIGVQTPHVFWWNPGDKSYLYKPSPHGPIISYEPAKSWAIAGKLLEEMMKHEQFALQVAVVYDSPDHKPQRLLLTYITEENGDCHILLKGYYTLSPETICRIYVEFKRWVANNEQEAKHE